MKPGETLETISVGYSHGFLNCLYHAIRAKADIITVTFDREKSEASAIFFPDHTFPPDRKYTFKSRESQIESFTFKLDGFIESFCQYRADGPLEYAMGDVITSVEDREYAYVLAHVGDKTSAIPATSVFMKAMMYVSDRPISLSSLDSIIPNQAVLLGMLADLKGRVSHIESILRKNWRDM